MAFKGKLGLGSDHAGFERKNQMMAALKAKGYDVADYGTNSAESCDYPDFAKSVAQDVAKGKLVKGILFCGTGIGMAIAANKVPKIRAAVCWNVATAEAASAHNNANVLCLPARLMEAEEMAKVIDQWLATPFAGNRHERRVAKIAEMEKSLC